MKEWINGACREAQGRGRVTIQYTDAVTGRVKEEIRGENHVFTPQFTATTGFQTTAMKADLLLCQGGSVPDAGASARMPFIPGEPIGYGRPNAEGSGLYRGTYRAADSWLNRVSRRGVSAKYVYDFLPTQARGRVDWVGLTAALGSGISTPSYQPPWQASSTSARVYDCGTGMMYRVSTVSQDSSYRVRYALQDCASGEAEEAVDLTALAGMAAFRTGTAYPRTVRIFLDKKKERAYVMCRGTPVGTTKAVYKVLAVTLDGSTLLGQWNIATGTEYVYEVTGPGGARDGVLWWMAPAADYKGYSRYTCDVEKGTITKVEIGLEDSARNLMRWDNSIAYFYDDCFWYPRADTASPDDSAYFLCGSPLFDLGNGAIHGLVPPGPRNIDAGTFHVGQSSLAALSGQWVATNVETGEMTMPFAYTCYQVPSGTPERPEGSGMTVTYELDVSW